MITNTCDKVYILCTLFFYIVGVWGLPPSAGGRSGLTRTEIIAIIAGVGGFLLIVILILFLCLVRRRQKPKRGRWSRIARKDISKKTSNYMSIHPNLKIFILRNRKHFPCFHTFIESRVEIWENEELKWEHEPL